MGITFGSSVVDTSVNWARLNAAGIQPGAGRNASRVCRPTAKRRPVARRPRAQAGQGLGWRKRTIGEKVGAGGPKGGRVLNYPPGATACRQWAAGRLLRTDRPGQARATAVAAVVGQLCRSVTGRAGAGYALQRQDAGRAKGVSRSANAAGMVNGIGDAVIFGGFTSLLILTSGRTLMFLCVTSLTTLMLPRARWPRLVWVAAGAKRQTTAPQPWWVPRAAKRLAPFARHGKDQFPAPGGCATAGGISSQPLNGARQPEDLNTPVAGLPQERRA